MKKSRTATAQAYPHVWRSFFTLLFKSRLPYVWMALALILSLSSTTLSLMIPNNMTQMLMGDYSTGMIMSVVFATLGSVGCLLLATAAEMYTRARIDRNMQRGALRKIISLNSAAAQRENPRFFISRITTDTTLMSSALLALVVEEIPRLYYMVSALFILYKDYDVRLALTTLSTIPLTLLGSYIAGKLVFGKADMVQSKISTLTGVLAEKIVNLPIIKSYGNEDRETEAGREISRELMLAERKKAVATRINSTIANLITFLPTLFIVIVGALMVRGEVIAKAQFVAFFLYSGTFCGYVTEHTALWASVKTAQGATYRLAQIMDLPEERTTGLTDKVDGDIVFEDVSFAYGENTVLDHVSFTAKQGQRTALVGFSGCGKTTTLKLLEQFFEPSGGRITVGGRDIREWNPKSYRESFIYMPQNAPAMQGTIRDMVTYGLKQKVSDETVLAAINAAHAGEMVEKLGGLDYEVGTAAEKLSGGQRQCLSIARAMLREAPYMLLDEATSALSASLALKAQEALNQKMAGKTMVIVAHNIATVRNADKIIVMENGRVAAQGTHGELMMSCPLYAQLVRIQSGEEA